MAELSKISSSRRFEFAEESADRSEKQGRIISLSKIETVSSTAVLSSVLDQFASQYEAGHLIPPPYNPSLLCHFTHNCDVMAQCIRAMKVNIDGMGWQLEYVPPVDQPDAEPSAADDVDRRKLQLLFDYPNAQESWTDLKENLRSDRCLTGYCAVEVVRNLSDEIAELHRVAASTMRMTARQANATEHVQWLRDGDEWIKTNRLTRFRRFQQMVNDKRVWFKEFGDPRSLNKNTGEYVPVDGRWAYDLEATEIIFIADDVQNSAYGEPPWLSEILNIMGSSEAKKVNYLYFNNKTIPPFIVTVAGGNLGPSAKQDLKDHLDQEFKGSDNFHKVLLLEAIPAPGGPVGDEKSPAVRINVQPMTQFLQSDGLFQEYIKNNGKAVRESFRLPALLVGGSEDHRFANAHEAMVITEQQVFQPERLAFDEKINRTIIADMGVQRWQMKSRGTPTSDDVQIITAMAAIPDAVPLGHAVDWISELMGKEPPPLDESVRNMLLGEYRSTYAPQGLFGTPGQSAEPEPLPAQKSGIFAVLKKLRDVLRPHKAA
jgi:PBSX family phage portal protein